LVKKIIEILGLWGLLIFLFVGLHECGPFNLVNIQAPLLCGLGPKLQSPMILTLLSGVAADWQCHLVEECEGS